MIRFFIDGQQRNISDILYGVPYEDHGIIYNDLYSVEYLRASDDVGALAEPNTYFVRDQTPLISPQAAAVATINNTMLFLVNKPPVTMQETLEFYENLSLTTGAIFALGSEVYHELQSLNQRTGHIKCALEELGEVSYLGTRKKSQEANRDKLKVYFADRIASVFYGFCVRSWSAEKPVLNAIGQLVLNEDIGPFERVENINDADLIVSFKTENREYMRMLTQRVENIYVPLIDEYRVFDPRSFFKIGNLSYVNEILSGTTNVTDHQIAGQFKALFESMYAYVQDVFVDQHVSTTVNTMKMSGSNSLFTALAYNLNRTI